LIPRSEIHSYKHVVRREISTLQRVRSNLALSAITPKQFRLYPPKTREKLDFGLGPFRATSGRFGIGCSRYVPTGGIRRPIRRFVVMEGSGARGIRRRALRVIPTLNAVGGAFKGGSVAGTIIQQEFFGSPEQEEIGEAMGWSEFEVIGRMAYLWNGSQRRKLSVVSAKQIGTWCKITDVEERTKLIEVLCSEAVGLLKRRRLDSFEVVGNKKQVKKLKQLSALRSAGGKATRAKFPAKSPNHANQNPERSPEQDAEVKLDPIPRLSIPRPTIPFHSPPCLSTPDEDQERFVFGEGEADRLTLEQAIERAEANGRAEEVMKLRGLQAQLRQLDEGRATA